MDWVDFQEQVSAPTIVVVASKLLVASTRVVLVKARGLCWRHCLQEGQPLFRDGMARAEGVKPCVVVCIIDLLCQ